MPAPSKITNVEITPDEDGCFLVQPKWSNVDRPVTGGYLVTSRKVADRLKRAMLAGAVFPEPAIQTDVNGKTFVHSRSTVLGRRANADLKRLGF